MTRAVPRSSSRRRIAAVGLALLACFAATLFVVPASADSKTQLLGEGEDWALPMLERLQANSATQIAPFQVGYLNLGDDQARQDVASGTADYASIGSPFSAAELATAKQNGRKIAYIPYAYGAVAIAFAIDVQSGGVVPSMKLTNETLAKIFTHQISIWGDPEILAENNPDTGGIGDAKIPGILTVTRLDSSWSTASLIQYFLSDPASRTLWNTYATGLSSPPDTLLDRWPAETVNSNLGIISGSKGIIDTMLQLDPATGVKEQSATTHHIAYLAPAWTTRYNATLVSIQNKAGQFVTPSSAGVLKAIEQGGTVEKNNIISLDFTKMTDPTAYPIPMVEYLAVPTTGLSADKAKALSNFVKYILSNAGQKDVADTGYVPVSPALRASGLKVAAELDATTGAQGSTTTTTKAGVTTTTKKVTDTTTDTTPTSGSAVDPASSGSSGSGSSSGSSLPFTGGPSAAVVAGAAGILCAAVLGRRRARRVRA